MAIENRYIRIEDWEGNNYFPTTTSETSTAGSITDSSAASTDPESSDTYTEGTKVADSTANGGNAIIIQSNTTAEQNVFVTSVSGVTFGSTYVGARIKSSIGSGTETLLRMETYFVDKTADEDMIEVLLSSTDITGSRIGVENEYTTVGEIVDYQGVATGTPLLKVKLIILPNTGCTVYFDQIAIALAVGGAAGGGKREVYVEGTTIIIGE